MQKYAYQRAKENGVDPAVLFAMIDQESTWNPKAYNRRGGGSGAHGLGQFREDAIKQYGISNPYDPYESIDGMIKYINHSKEAGLTGLDVPLSYHDGITGRKLMLSGKKDRKAPSREYEKSIRRKIEMYRKKDWSELNR